METTTLERATDITTMKIDAGHIHLNYKILGEDVQNNVQAVLEDHGVEGLVTNNGILKIPQFVTLDGKGRKNIAGDIGKAIKYRSPKESKKKNVLSRSYPDVLDFEKIQKQANLFADYLELEKERIIEILLEYETHEVANDEIERSLDLLRSLHENEEYFKRRVGNICTFLPSNQPLYALTCFAIVPSLMAEEVHVKCPSGMKYFFGHLIDAIEANRHFPNIRIHDGNRQDFVAERAKMVFNQGKNRHEPVTDAVIFTGTSEKADLMRQAFSRKVLFIVNGSGHNPIVVTETADLDKAVSSSMRVQLYNQGQDCAGPNAILVHKEIYGEFIEKLTTELSKVKVGPYKNRENTVGPISKRGDLLRIVSLIEKNREYLSSATRGIVDISSKIVNPVIIEKPLKDGGNFTEQFAPIFFVQKYDSDEQLSSYFDTQQYRSHAMYITVFGEGENPSSFVKSLKETGLHDESTIVINKDLHSPGVERGSQPYGGYGKGASSISINGKTEAKPTLPQRDIYEQLVKPTIESEARGA